MGINRTTDPTEEPITLDQAKDHLRVTHDEDDAYITLLIQAARESCENYTKRAYITQTWTMTLDSFPSVIELPWPNLISVTSIQYVDTAGDTQTWSSSYYDVDTSGLLGRIQPVYGYSWPSVRDKLAPITIVYTAGFGDAADVPETIKSAMKLMIHHLYVIREPVVTGTIAAKLPLSVEWLLAPHCVRRFM